MFHVHDCMYIYHFIMYTLHVKVTWSVDRNNV